MNRNRRNFLSATAAAATLTAARPLFAETLPQPAAPPAPAPALSDGDHAPAAAVTYAAPTEVRKIEIINLRELEPAAQKILPTGGFGYIASGAGDEWTKRENEGAYKRLTIKPHYLSGYGDADCSTILLGSSLAMPIITTVMGGHGIAHVSAEVGTAKGTGAAGALFIAPSQSNKTLEETAQASAGPKWFQIYIPVDPGVARAILLRAKAAGYRAIVVTIDNVYPSNRETDLRNHFHSPLPNANFPGEKTAYGKSPFKRDLGWDDIAFVQKVTGLPVIVKGVLSPEVALQAVENGCAAIQVSNHGGRQLDDVPATITVLPRIAEVVRGRIPIIVDGGIRRGQDVFKALALGADAVAIGRPILFGLALGGWMGVQDVLDHLKGELIMTMRLGGARTLSEISPQYLA